MNGEYSEFFESILGVKQGDPLSPLLFCLLIDRFQQYVEERSPGMGIRMGVLLAIVLFFADDLLIVAKSPTELQHFLNLLQSFCADIKLTVNITKTVGMVFNGGKKTTPVVYYNGQQLQFVEQVKYLGAIFHAKQGVKASRKNLLAAGKRAVHALHKCCAAAGINMPLAKCQIFDTQVMPVLTYAAEVWAVWCGTDCSVNKCVDNDIERLHLGFLRHLFGIRLSTSSWMILREFGRLPIFYFWWSKVIKFLIRMEKKEPVDSPIKQAYLSDLELLEKGKSCWMKCVLSFLQILFDDFPTFSDVRSIQQKIRGLSLMDVRKAMVQKWKEFWVEVSQGTRQATKSLYYSTYVAGDVVHDKHEWFIQAPHLHVYMSGVLHSNLTRFRLGNHDLLVEKRRWVKPEYRDGFDCTCRCCGMGRVEDEYHFLFECVHFERIRLEDKYADMLSSAGGDIRTLLTYKDQLIVAKFISDMTRARTQI
jgi:Reverse transcriptase (RNA-dependent DNA polymerase)